MTAPLIAAAITASGSRGEGNPHDPVSVGFDSFAEMPSASRLLVARKMFEAATMGSELPRDIVRQYAGNIAAAAVATASSTGLSKITSSLLYRATKEHYQYETEERIAAEIAPLKSALDASAATLKRSQRRQLCDIVTSHDLVARGVRFNGYARGKGYGFYSDYNTPILDAAEAAVDEDLTLAAFEVVRPKLFGAAPEAATVALGGLAHLHDRIASELNLLQSTVGAVRELVPDFATDY